MTTRSRSISSVPRATKSADRTRAPHSSISPSVVPGSVRADSATRATPWMSSATPPPRAAGSRRSRAARAPRSELVSRCRQALELGLGVGEQLASSLRLAPGAIDLLRPGAPRRLEPGESRLGRLELGARARGRPLGFPPTCLELRELFRDSLETRVDLPRASTDRARPLVQLADNLELARERLVALGELACVREVLGCRVGAHGAIVAGRRGALIRRLDA